MDKTKLQPINETYICLQGEGKLTGVPSILIRFSGCHLRCMWSETEFCDSWYSSWSPEKGKYSLQDIENLVKSNPQIKHSIVSGGEPCINPNLLQELCILLKSLGHHITIETAGTDYVETEADLISLSPKLFSSTPIVGTKKIWDEDKLVTQTEKDLHSKHRCNYTAMKALIMFHLDYQFKPVVGSEEDLMEALQIMYELNVPREKVYLMAPGATEKELAKKRIWLQEKCIELGYNYTDRLHIITHDSKRLV